MIKTIMITLNQYKINRNHALINTLIKDGDEIAVLGIGCWKDFKSLDLPEKYGKILEITSNKKRFVYINNDPKIIKKGLKDFRTTQEYM